MVEMELSGQYGTPAISIVHCVLEWWQCVGSRRTQYRFLCTINTSQYLASTSLQTFQLQLLNAMSHQVLDNLTAHPTAQLNPYPWLAQYHSDENILVYIRKNTHRKTKVQW